MRTIVKCLNCGIVWVRVTSWGTVLEMTEDLMYLCPSCHSNWFESYENTNPPPKPPEGPPVYTEKVFP